MSDAARWWGGAMAAVLAIAMPGTSGVAAEPRAPEQAVRESAAAYVTAFNGRDFAALADQWAERAELVEGGGRVTGREAIVASIRGWLERHPQATLQIDVEGVELLAAPLARVRGTMRFARKPGDRPTESRFTSLRVLEGGTWRLAESIVAPSHAAALDDLEWLVGAWQSAAAADGTTVEATFERVAGGHAIVGRMKVRPKSGPASESIEVIHADRRAGVVRSWVCDSTGAMAEGVVEADGAGVDVVFIGTPGDGVDGRVARWVRVVAPTGDGRFTLHAIERSIDGSRVSDGEPRHFRKVR